MTAETVKGSKAADMEEFKATPYYQSLGIDQLQQQAAAYDVDDAELTRQAEAQYAPGYRTETEAIRQQLEQEVQGLNSRRGATETAYERQRRQTDESYDESQVRLNNELNRRGLGRSSLVATQGAYLENQRNRALADIAADETAAISAINEQIELLTRQAAQKERTLSGDYAKQLENRVNELREQNRSASISLQLQIAALQQQGYEAYQKWMLENRAQELKEQEFDAEYGVEENVSSGGTGRTEKKTGGQGGGTAKTNDTAGEAAKSAAKAVAGSSAALIRNEKKQTGAGQSGVTAALKERLKELLQKR